MLARVSLPPGITGRAQLLGFRGEIDRPEVPWVHFAHDFYSIANWSLPLDLKKFVHTPMSLLGGRAAR